MFLDATTDLLCFASLLTPPAACLESPDPTFISEDRSGLPLLRVSRRHHRASFCFPLAMECGSFSASVAFLRIFLADNGAFVEVPVGPLRRPSV